METFPYGFFFLLETDGGGKKGKKTPAKLKIEINLCSLDTSKAQMCESQPVP